LSPYLNATSPIHQLDGAVDLELELSADSETDGSFQSPANTGMGGAAKQVGGPEGGRPAPAPPPPPQASADTGRPAVRLRTTALDFSKWSAVFQIDRYDSIHEQFHHNVPPSCFLCAQCSGRSYANGWRTSYPCSLAPAAVWLKLRSK
jgi:hypothetical protein